MYDFRPGRQAGAAASSTTSCVQCCTFYSMAQDPQYSRTYGDEDAAVIRLVQHSLQHMHMPLPEATILINSYIYHSAILWHLFMFYACEAHCGPKWHIKVGRCRRPYIVEPPLFRGEWASIWGATARSARRSSGSCAAWSQTLWPLAIV